MINFRRIRPLAPAAQPGRAGQLRPSSGRGLPRRRLLGVFLSSLVVPPAAEAQAVRGRPALSLRFRVDVPEKDWRLVPGGLSTLGSIVHKDDGIAIVIEHELLQIALTAEEIDANFAELELGAIKERETAGSAFTGELAQVGGRRMVVINFQRRGTTGTEQVRVFVLLEGRHLYRLVCVAPANQFARHVPAFQLASSSFRPLD